MNILDDLEKIRRLDKQGMLLLAENFHGQLAEAKKIAEAANLEGVRAGGFAGLAITGMGASGFTGDFINSLVKDSVKIPVIVVKGYDLPAYISKEWLVVAVSYSGNTEETLAAVNQAYKRGCEIVSISSGGRLEETARAAGRVNIKIPGGMKPGGASGFLLFSAVIFLKRLGLIEISDEDIEEALELVKQKSSFYHRKVVSDRNMAKQLAFDLYASMPVIYGTEGYLSAVAYRWKCRINENSKCPCFSSEFPELNHNETAGWQNLREVSEHFVLVVLKDDNHGERIKFRIDLTVRLVQDQFEKVIEIPVDGKSKLARALSSIYLGDIASIYLAFLYNTDPSQAEMISAMKTELSKFGTS